MKRTKKFLVGLLAALSVLSGSLGLAACDESESSSSVNGSNSSNVEQSSDSNVSSGIENGSDDKGSLDEEMGVVSQGLEYTLLDDDTYAVIGIGDCADTEIVIPSCHNGKAVTTISEFAFYNFDSLTSIEISDSVTVICENAFRGCDSLTEMTLPFVGASKTATDYQGVFGYIFGYTTASSSGFLISGATYQYYSCDGQAYYYYIPASLKKVNITGEKIGSNAFYGCDSLTSVTIGDDVTFIGNYAFCYCESLTSVTIPDGVTFIGDYVFDNCSSLKYNVKDDLKYLGNEQNPYLYLMGVNDASIARAMIENVCKFIGSNAFYKCIGLTIIEIPDSVTSIGAGAFRDCSSLRYNVKGNLRYLGNEQNPYLYLAGVNDTSIISATIESNCKIIGYKTFENCRSLTSVTISDGVAFIGDSAFSGCSGLTSVYIPKGVTHLSSRAFLACDNLKSITVSGENMAYTSQDGIVYNKEKTELICIPDNVTGAIVILESVTSIGHSAFSDCSSLTSITIPNSVTSIGHQAFYGCYRLTIIFNGTIEEWNTIKKGSWWNYGVPTTKVVCADGEVSL